MKTLIFMASLLALSVSSLGQESAYKTFGDNKVYYSAFNSSFLDADIANLYNITRGKNKGLVNVAVVPDGSGYGATAMVGGSVTNLLQQQQTLTFDEIREGEAVYYLAPFDFDHEEPLNFTINVRPAGADTSHTITFQRTLHKD